MFKVGDVVVVSEEHKTLVKKSEDAYYPWWVESLEDEFVVQRVDEHLGVSVRTPRNPSFPSTWIASNVLVLKGDKTVAQSQQEKDQLEKTIEQLKQRLIEAERNALYWTAFDCPVNRDIAERILRKEN
jgi:hypothetical protein